MGIDLQDRGREGDEEMSIKAYRQLNGDVIIDTNFMRLVALPNSYTVEKPVLELPKDAVRLVPTGSEYPSIRKDYKELNTMYTELQTENDNLKAELAEAKSASEVDRLQNEVARLSMDVIEARRISSQRQRTLDNARSEARREIAALKYELAEAIKVNQNANVTINEKGDQINYLKDARPRVAQGGIISSGKSLYDKMREAADTTDLVTKRKYPTTLVPGTFGFSSRELRSWADEWAKKDAAAEVEKEEMVAKVMKAMQHTDWLSSMDKARLLMSKFKITPLDDESGS